jgi:hypothetical protein
VLRGGVAYPVCIVRTALMNSSLAVNYSCIEFIPVRGKVCAISIRSRPRHTLLGRKAL